MPVDDQPVSHLLTSAFLQREVRVDFYLPPQQAALIECDLLLINDGQDLITMDFNRLLGGLNHKITPLFCVGIHCGPDRKNEYGTAHLLNDKGQGAKAGLYTRFILEELIPFIKNQPGIPFLTRKSFCGFSLGGLSALDIVWNHPRDFSRSGVFSGSFWWRSVAQTDPGFNENEHRIMHSEIRKGNYYPGLQFFFETGTLDETADRNHNGIIDSIDDTLSLIDELVRKGYDRKKEICYLEIEGGRHDLATWAKAFPGFLKWGWGR